MTQDDETWHGVSGVSVWYIWLTIAMWLVLCNDVRWSRKGWSGEEKSGVERNHVDVARNWHNSYVKILNVKRKGVKKSRREKRKVEKLKEERMKSKREEGYLCKSSFTEDFPPLFYSF